MKITIRKATTDDAETLSFLGNKTFYEKWKETTSEENMKHYLEQTFSPDKLREEIADPTVIYLVAESNGAVVAYAKLLHTKPDIEIAEPGIMFTSNRPIEISRIYVAPELIGKSVGSGLMETILKLANEELCDLIWLGVWENNPAVRFYQRHGFVKAGTHKFIFGDQVDTDWVMVRTLQETKPLH